MNTPVPIQQVFESLWRRSRHSLSLFMVGVCVVFFAGTGLATALRIVDRGDLVACLGLSYAGVVERHWLFQWVTAPLLHANVYHLLFNMLSLWMLGPDIEGILGRRRYIVLSITSAVCGMAGFLVLDRGQGHIVMGYSGVIFGILVAQAVFNPDKRLLLYFFPIPMRHAVLILGAVELYLAVAPEEGGTVAHAAHLFGAGSAYGLLRFWRRRCGGLHPAASAVPAGPSTVPPTPRSGPAPKRKLRRNEIPDRL
ncbi:MAG TPA: rhomboid family intramembrane serine protease [Verrucomicrobiota bacterium]|nr:rhomboid family intramembrane serine protease [Verrucomicrobiota bacterium]HNU51610.1 rhomboid family intramembrane serine protease [Verrucomicrobiota bacterium]